ncbi:hypothetical protein [Actinoplanes sp. NPDC051851]|uniref:hypothetical protein n=1 Tax=Actinoplanes sp. NPDC051851 TaxID=3154753 RepID=UPI00342BFA45
MHSRRVVALVLAGVLLAACSRESSPAAGPALRLRATGEQWRVHEVNRQLAVALYNDGAVPVHVSRVEPVLPDFDGAAAVGTDALLPVGGLRVDVPVSYGTGRTCDARAVASHVVVTARPDGATRWQRLTLALPYPNPLLDRLLADDCATRRIQQSVTLAFGPWTDHGATGLTGSLTIERTAAATGTVQVRELDGNVMYDLTPGTAPATTPPATTVPVSTVLTSTVLTAANPRAEIPLTVRPNRCDLHAFAEVKKPYEFLAHVSLDGADPLATALPVSESDKSALDAMLRRICKVP